MLLNAVKELTLKNSAYKKAVHQYVWQAYLNDLSNSDLTTQYFVLKRSRIIEAEIIAKESGILAGIMEVEWFLRKLDRINDAEPS